MSAKKRKVSTDNAFVISIWVFYALLVIAPLICFSPVFDAQFINLDDSRFIQNNKIVKEGSLSNIPAAFRQQLNSPHYKPLVYVSWIIEASIFGTDPFIYHFNNLLLHILNILLVFGILRLILPRAGIEGDNLVLISFLGALLFALHPFKVESVAWAVERKDVLFSLFYLLGMFYYARYLGEKRKVFLYVSIVCYILTLLSKSMGISLIASLLLLDMLWQRKLNKQLIIEKIPFFVVAFAMLGVYGIYSKFDRVTLGVTEGLLAEEQTVIQPKNFDGLHPFYKQVLVMNYRLIGFIVHLLAPVKLAITYPRAYFLDLAGSFIHVLPFITATLIALAVWFYKRARWVAFGLGFYFLTIFPALVMGDKGTNFLPDRYMYIPSLGIFFLLIAGIFLLFRNATANGFKLIVGVLILISMFYGFVTYNYAAKWKDSVTLWTDAIDKYPGMLEVAYKNRALENRRSDKLDEALKDYLVLEKMQVKEAGIYGNIANIYGSKRMYDKSLEYYTKAIEKDEAYFNAYLNRGITYAQRRMFDEAFQDFEIAFSLDSTSDKLLESYGYASYEAGIPGRSVKLYSQLINKGANEERFYFQRAMGFFVMQNYTEAVEDFLKVVSMNPSNGDALYNCSASYYNLNRIDLAFEYAEKAQKIGFKVSPEYLQKLQRAKHGG